MIKQAKFPKRLIEVDLPIKRISVHARREKDMRRGHVPLIHIWPATRPLAACRAVICAALWPDPADDLCPESFRIAAAEIMSKFRDSAGGKARNWGNHIELRNALLDFIADFTEWDNSTNARFLETSRQLTMQASMVLNGNSIITPLVLDSFAGAGAIPIESLRVGAHCYANDLNPVAALLLKTVIEYIPLYGLQLAEDIKNFTVWLERESKRQLEQYYPIDENGGTATAYLWARTIRCEGPRCGAQIPLMRSLWLAKKTMRSVALQILTNDKDHRIQFMIIEKKDKGDWLVVDVPKDIKKLPVLDKPKFSGTIARGAVTCPICHFTTPVTHVREQFKSRNGGTSDAMLTTVVTVCPNRVGRLYRLPTENDIKAYRCAETALKEQLLSRGQKLIPDEALPPEGALGFRVQKYGFQTWSDLFNRRQLLAITTIIDLATKYLDDVKTKDKNYVPALGATIALLIDKLIDNNAALCMWQLNTPNAAHVFSRWAMPMVWDFAEVNPISQAGGSPHSLSGKVIDGIMQLLKGGFAAGHMNLGSATEIKLPDNSVSAFITDPPYYDAIAYADISDFFYVWLKRCKFLTGTDFFKDVLTPKEIECIVDNARGKDELHFQKTMTAALNEARRVLEENGIGIIIFAHKSTKGWESLLDSIIGAGWIITGSWPIDTEMEFRMRGRDSAALASSVHLVCRPRMDFDQPSIGEWRDVLQELPSRIHEWMPRLAEEGVVGADAIFACLGPALEIFSRHSRVEKASGETVTLKEYLEQVWAAVAKEALSLVFKDADTTGLESDARLTAMWLWTLNANATTADASSNEDDEESEDDEEPGSKSAKTKGGFVLEFDAARKIAQGLGANLEKMTDLVEIKGETARLIPVAERARFLFGKDDVDEPLVVGAGSKRKRKNENQKDFFAELMGEEASLVVQKNIEVLDEGLTGKAGATILDKVHQSMILFGVGRSEALKRFLVEDGIGQDQRFWHLAQALSALYPATCEEKRWVDGVLARKKGLGF